jgi:FkbM family methyltransferase
MQPVNLPNGMNVSVLNEEEAKVLYHEIFVQKSYLKNGIQVRNGDCIFDVGANIGLYTIFASSLFENLKIFAFEPVPDIFSVLEDNIKKNSTTSEIEIFNLGLSCKSGTCEFEFNQRLSFAATMYTQEIADCVSQDASVYDWARAIIIDMHKVSLISDGFAHIRVHPTFARGC